MDRFQKQWIRREFNKTNGMIFLYKILFSQLTIFIMMTMYRLFPADENFNDGAVWYLISEFSLPWTFCDMAQTFLFPNTDLPGSYYHESWKISWFFRNFHDCTECFFHSLCTHGNRRTTLWLYIRTFPGSRYRRLCYAFYVFIFWICCSAGRRIDLPRRCFKNIWNLSANGLLCWHPHLPLH